MQEASREPQVPTDTLEEFLRAAAGRATTPQQIQVAARLAETAHLLDLAAQLATEAARCPDRRVTNLLLAGRAVTSEAIPPARAPTTPAPTIGQDPVAQRRFSGRACGRGAAIRRRRLDKDPCFRLT